MAEVALDLAVHSEPSVIVVEGSDHHIGIDSVNERNLIGRKPGSIDSERLYAHVMQCHRVERTLNEYDGTPVIGAVVEEKPAHVNRCGIPILRSISVK